MEKNSSNGNLPEVKGLVEKYKYDVIAILLLAMLFYGISSIAFGDGLLPNSTYEKLSWLRTATSGGGQSQAGLGGGAVGLEGIGSYHSAKTLEFAGMLAGADVQSAAGLEQAYRLSYLISVVLICAGAYVYSRALGLERQWAFAASCIITSTPYVLLSFATQAGLAPVLAFALCIVGLAAFSLMKKSPLFAIPGFVFSAAGLLSDPHLGLAGALIGFAGACTVILHAMNKNTENTEGRGTGAKLDFARLAPLAAFLLLGAVSALVGSQSFSWYEFQAQKFLFNNIFLAAAASPLLAIAIGKSKQGRELEGLTMFVFALIAGSAFPLAGLFLLAAALPHGIRALLEAGESRIVAAAFAIGFFIAVSLSTHSELVQTLGLGLLFGGFLAGVAYV
ncbi:hypothetical protein FJZ26_05110, partial [Candidatus Parvarchaeota archaeon]|nr:hypothetical protein [Candidatus Parvarchaeota archaeon]